MSRKVDSKFDVGLVGMTDISFRVDPRRNCTRSEFSKILMMKLRRWGYFLSTSDMAILLRLAQWQRIWGLYMQEEVLVGLVTCEMW